MTATEEKFLNSENFFITDTITKEYDFSKNAISEAMKPAKKKVYRSMNKMLQECFFVGSLKYGNNFIA